MEKNDVLLPVHEVRPSLLKKYPVWTAFLVEVLESSGLPPALLKRKIRRLAGLYLLAGVISFGFHPEVAKKIVNRFTSFKVTSQKAKAVARKLKGVKVSVYQRGGATLGEALGNLCPEEISGVRVPKYLAERVRKKIERKEIKGLPLKVIEEELAREIRYARSFGKRANIEFAARRAERKLKKLGFGISRKSILKEMRGRVYKRIVRGKSPPFRRGPS